MAVYYHSGGGRKPNQNDHWDWLPIIVLFCIPTPFTWVVAFFLLVSKLKGGGKKSTVKRHPYDLQQESAGRAAYAEEQRAQQTASRPQAAARPETAARSKANKQTARGDSRKATPAREGKGSGALILFGSILTAVFSVGFIGALGDAIRWGTLSYALDEVLVLLFFVACGVAMVGTGLGKKRRAERYSGYLAYIGANREVPLANMAAAFGVSVSRLCKDLRTMLTKGILPAGYLDLAEGKLYLTELGYRAPKKEEPKKEEPAPQVQDENAILREIRQVNDDIPDEEMSEKIDRIEEITRKILVYQKQHPEKAGQLRSFLNYYLPTTLKILRAYAQLDAQGIEGENISAAKARIEGMMDQVVAGFEKQLDKLFRDDALDIATDVKVLEDMLKKDGLSDDGSMTMTMM